MPAHGRALGDSYRVEVRIVIWRADDVTSSVPVGSLFRRGDGWAVFVVDSGRARLRTVELGQRNGDVRRRSSRACRPGELVVLHPPDTLADGARVIERESS